MKDARLYRAGVIRLGDAEQPTPGQGESLVRVSAVRLCGSDLHWFDEGGIGDAKIGTPLGDSAGCRRSIPASGQRR